MKIKRKYLEFLLRAMSFETDECILWPWGTQTGYGSFFKDKKRALAHIFVCHGAHGEPPTTKHEVAHSCGVRKCINKRHLRWATKSENMADKLIHGTHNRGERGGLTKLTKEQVIEIRTGKRRQTALAKEFGVTVATINDAKHHRTWSWLK